MILTGDFNFLPDSVPYEIIAKSMKSGFKDSNKNEASITFPTGLIGEYADINAHGELDYILLRGKISSKKCKVLQIVDAETYGQATIIQFIQTFF